MENYFRFLVLKIMDSNKLLVCLYSRSDVCCFEQSLKDNRRDRAGSIKVLLIRTVIITNKTAVNLEIKYNTQYCNGVASHVGIYKCVYRHID